MSADGISRLASQGLARESDLSLPARANSAARREGARAERDASAPPVDGACPSAPGRLDVLAPADALAGGRLRGSPLELVMGAAIASASVAGAVGRPLAGWTAVAVAAGAGAAAGRIRAVGLLELAALAAAHHALAPGPAGDLGVALLALPLALHLAPGFVPWAPFGAERLRPGARPYTQQISPDKHIAGGMLWLRLAQNAPPTAGLSLAGVAASGGIACATVATLMGAGLGTGYVVLDPRPPRAVRSLLWALDNLLVTCVAEEALFRGAIQPSLAALGGGGPLATGASVVVAAAAFGLAHHRGGSTYVLLSAIAGAGYGAAALCGRVVGSIAAHFALNATHFFAFTYPAIDRRRAHAVA